MSIDVKVLADSSCDGVRLTTLQLRYPRMIHAEVMTHRLFSRNASSSRAVPIKKVIAGIEADPAVPLWTLNEPGMSGKFADAATSDKASKVWLEALKDVTKHVERLIELGIHKQDANRLLEPFSHISVVLSSTEWDHFMNVRPKPDAQPVMQELAVRIREELVASKPLPKEYWKPTARPQLAAAWRSSWHLPYVEPQELEELANPSAAVLEAARTLATIPNVEDLLPCLVSASRCARVSYLNHEGERDLVKDITLACRLLTSCHWSALEHQATPRADHGGRTSNFKKPWHQLRTHLEIQPPSWDKK
jgi:thymidylate synthase ThyX